MNKSKTKTISLTQGKFAIVDAADFEELSLWKWCARSIKHLWYACRSVRDNDGKRKTVFLHRAILDAPGEMEVDHVNGNGLDNRRDNLRLATRTQNNHNRRIGTDNRSGFNGVSWSNTYHKWRATIGINGKRLHVGYYDDPIKAAVGRDLAAIKHYGEFACLNFPGGRYA